MSLITLDDSRQNKLGLVNRCLQAIGEAPLPKGSIPSEFNLGSDAQVASSIVDDVWLEVQNKGWWFNVQKAFKLFPDSQGFIAFPETVIRIDGGRYQSLVKKQGLLYDTKKQSFIFEEPIEVDLVWAVSYSDLPIGAYEYIASKASRKFQQKVIGNPEQVQMLLMEEQESLADLQRENAQYLDQSLIERQVSYRWMNPIRGV
jgi:hypothetical protein